MLSCCLLAGRVDAQVIETPVPFDSAGRIRVLTPPLVSRFGLGTTVWPVQGDFAEARLYASSGGDTVLVVTRRSGVVERYTLAGPGVSGLRGAVADALVRTGPFVAEGYTESARRAFARNQLILALALYGPGLAALANDARTGSVLYLVGAGGTYFAVAALSRNMHVTPAQNHLSTDGALRGFAAANGLLYAFAGDFPDRKTVSGVGLLGAVLGSIGGFQRGRRLSEAEAHASTSASTLAALTTFGALASVLDLDSLTSDRAVAGALVGAGIAGYFAGPAYPRRSRFNITAGDVKILWVGATLGTAAAVTPIVDADIDSQLGYAIATLGLLGGVAVTHSTWVRNYDHSMGDVLQTWLGAIAGGLLGGALIVVTEPDPPVAMGMATLGGIIGAIAAHQLARPAPGERRSASRQPALDVGRARVELSPLNLALSAARQPGTYPVVTVRF